MNIILGCNHLHELGGSEQHLYSLAEEFKNLNPTAENICYVIWQILREKLDNKYELTIRLYETPRNYVEYPV